jgi:hypothetical protein
MTIWEKVTINLEKASKKITTMSALLADRVKAEITIVRLRLRRDELQSLINEQYRAIGKRIVDLGKKDQLPRSTDQLMNEEEIAAAVAEIAARERELEELSQEIAREQDAFKTEQQGKEEKTL